MSKSSPSQFQILHGVLTHSVKDSEEGELDGYSLEGLQTTVLGSHAPRDASVQVGKH